MAADDERPPLLGSWRRVYWLVFLALALEVVIGTIISRVYG